MDALKLYSLGSIHVHFSSVNVPLTMKANKSNIFRGVKNMDPLVISTLDA